MRTWTDARNRSGLSRSALIASARLSLRRDELAQPRLPETEKIAISAAGEEPVPARNASTISSSVAMQRRQHIPDMIAPLMSTRGSPAQGAPTRSPHHARRCEAAARGARSVVAEGRTSAGDAGGRRRCGARRPIENAEYIYGKRRLREIDRRVRFLTKRLEEVTIVSEAPNDPTRVFFGAWVTLEDEGGGEASTGSSAPTIRSAGSISVDSPVARGCSASGTGTRSRCASPRARSCTRSRESATREQQQSYPDAPRRRAGSAGGGNRRPPRSRRSPTGSPAGSRISPGRGRDHAAAGHDPVRAYGGGWRAGCEVIVLRNGGEVYPAMLAAMAAAKTTNCVETYILASDLTGDRFKDVLIERAKAASPSA